MITLGRGIASSARLVQFSRRYGHDFGRYELIAKMGTDWPVNRATRSLNHGKGQIAVNLRIGDYTLIEMSYSTAILLVGFEEAAKGGKNAPHETSLPFPGVQRYGDRMNPEYSQPCGTFPLIQFAMPVSD